LKFIYDPVGNIYDYIDYQQLSILWRWNR
jgi:hypothetical protein